MTSSGMGRIAALMALTGLLLVGCSGDDESTAGSTTTGGPASSAAASSEASSATSAASSSAPGQTSSGPTSSGPTTTERATTSTLEGAVTTERSATTTTDPAGGGSSTTLPASASGLVLAADGLTAVSFGATAENTSVEVGDVLGPSVAGAAGECDAGPLDQLSWGSTLRVYLKAGKFVGWFTRSAELRTAQRVGVGSTRADMEAAYGSALAVQTGSLGVEWTVTPGGPSGLFTTAASDATVSAAWAGIICAAR